MSRTRKHSGPIKALQFNAFRSELLATGGAKGELFISDLNNIGNPFRMGNAIARADDFDCLDWNKRTAHILATGSSGGTMTVWDVKNKRESLTLNNLGRKPVSAIAWDPVKTTRLITAIPSDTDPLILVWDLRNANAPEKVLRGHDGGVLSLSWCAQDNDLLLSCGKDNRNIVWNPQTGDCYGEYPVVTNWTFQTRWNPCNPSLIATASFDGKIMIQSIQNTRSDTDRAAAGGQLQNVDDDDFFSKAQTQSQGPRFTLQKAPKWLQPPCGASFGFGGKIVNFKTIISETAKRSVMHISSFTIDDEIASSTESFELALKAKNLDNICKERVTNATSAEDKADWKVIETLTSDNPRKGLIEYLGFSNQDDEAADGISKLSANGDQEEEPQKSRATSASKSNRLSSFFDNTTDGDAFLSELAATKGAKLNNPFQLYSGTESESERRITRALLLGEFEKALGICLQEGRTSDAFMIAICGGQKCIEKAQKAYFNQKSNGPKYLRLLASVVGKNLWDLVHNADLENWKEIMASLCTYADADEFPDLCEALGDRLEEHITASQDKATLRKDASFCFLAGSKLEKVVGIWIADLQEDESAGLQDSSKASSFSVHARSLQGFIEKVTVFREVTQYQDSGQATTSDWKLAALYDKYCEYADIASAHGQLDIAQRYLAFLPDSYPAAEVAKNRVQQAVRKAGPQPATKQSANAPRAQPRLPQSDFQQEQSSARPANAAASTNSFVPSVQGTTQNPYAPSSGSYNTPGYKTTGGYQPSQYQQQPQQGMAPLSGYPAQPQQQSIGPPPRNLNASPSIPPPSKATNMSNWNDMPADFFKPPVSRRGTPGAGANQPSAFQPTQQSNSSYNFGSVSKFTPPLGPPPKGSAAPPPSVSSPTTNQQQQTYQPSERSSSVANAYAPQSSHLPVQQQPTIPRGPSPYNPPPSAAPPSNRYAPAQPLQNGSSNASQQPPSMPGAARQGPPQSNPYAPQQQYDHPQQIASQQPPPPVGLPSRPSGPSTPSLQQHGSRPGTSHSQRKSVPTPKYRKSSQVYANLSCLFTKPYTAAGDRSHIPPAAQPVFDLLNSDMQRVKSKAPSSFKAQVNDTEKRLNILFDHLNNEDLLKADTVQSMVELAQGLQAKNFEQAQAIHVEIMTNKTDECGNWMVRNSAMPISSKD